MKNVLVVYKKSTLEFLLVSQDEHKQAFATEESLRKSHEEHYKTLDEIGGVLQHHDIPHTVIYRADLEIIEGYDAVISVGGDGTLLEVSHYVGDTPILGVNSDTAHSVGFFSSANRTNFADMLDQWETLPRTVLHRMQLVLDGVELSELVLNDVLLANRNPASTTRYEINGNAFKSSGLLICTAAGSTGWMYQEGGIVMPLSSSELQWYNRGIRGEDFQFSDALTIKATTSNTKLYIDGAHLRKKFPIGSVLKVTPGKPLTIVGDLEVTRNDYK
jgi:NAD+ kinase